MLCMLSKEKTKQKQLQQNMFKNGAEWAEVWSSKLLKNVKEIKMKVTSEANNSLNEALSVLRPIQQVAFQSPLNPAK